MRCREEEAEQYIRGAKPLRTDMIYEQIEAKRGETDRVHKHIRVESATDIGLVIHDPARCRPRYRWKKKYLFNDIGEEPFRGAPRIEMPMWDGRFSDTSLNTISAWAFLFYCD